jgi:4-alpha-glucanotransferase
MLAGGALRIDHVMRFFRLYWIPEGFSASEGAYVRDYAENLVRILALESVRNQVLVVGEDLGTVEPETREALEKFGILSYRLFYFEREGDGSMKAPENYPTNALVSTTTHDLPTLAGAWIGRDIEARDYSGLLPEHSEYERQWAERRDLKQRILDALFEEKLMPEYYTRWANDIPELTGELHNAVIGYLARTPSKLFQVNQEDLTKFLDQQNLPGSTWQYPNWQRKTGYYLEDLRSDPLVRGCAAMLVRWLKESGRDNGR